jgi:ribosomal protein S1
LTISSGFGTVGVVVKITEHGIIVEFFGGICGFIGRPQLDLVANEAIDEKYHPGQLLKCTVTKVDPQQQKYGM